MGFDRIKNFFDGSGKIFGVQFRMKAIVGFQNLPNRYDRMPENRFAVEKSQTTRETGPKKEGRL